MDYDDPIDLTSASVPPSRSRVWRARAVELAVERHLVGQAMPVNSQQTGQPWDPTAYVTTYRCVSASEPTDHYITYLSTADTVVCDCYAGQHERPCSHAGAVLLHLKGLAPVRQRDPEGFTHGTPNASK